MQDPGQPPQQRRGANRRVVFASSRRNDLVLSRDQLLTEEDSERVNQVGGSAAATERLQVTFNKILREITLLRRGLEGTIGEGRFADMPSDDDDDNDSGE